MLTEGRIPVRYLFDKVKVDVFAVMLFSVAFHGMKYFVVEHLPEIPLQVPAVLGTSIALLLAFNLNQSYDRWWEARKIWGAIVNDSRTLTLQLQQFVGEAGGETRREDPSVTVRRMVHRQIAWCYALGRTLRRQQPAITDAQRRLLHEEELPFVEGHSNKPFALLLLHGQDLRRLRQWAALNEFQQVQLDQTLVRLCDSMGRAERIKSTFFPATYRLFIHILIYLFLIMLSVPLVEIVGMFEIPILIAIATTFFMLEKTARHMQDPFEDRPTDTAMTAIARTIEINLRQALDETEVPAPLTPERFYLM